MCTSGRIASSTKTSTNLHCTVTAPTVHREFKHQISLNMFFRRRIAIHKAHANVMTTGNHVFAFRALSTFVTRTPHRTNHPTRLLRRLGLLQHLWWSFIQAPLPSLPFCVSSHRTYEHSRTLPSSKRADCSRHLNPKLHLFFIFFFSLCFLFFHNIIYIILWFLFFPWRSYELLISWY